MARPNSQNFLLLGVALLFGFICLQLSYHSAPASVRSTRTLPLRSVPVQSASVVSSPYNFSRYYENLPDGPARYKLPPSYRERQRTKHHNDEKWDSERALVKQVEVYETALHLLKINGWDSVADVGCGSGYKLVNMFEGYRRIGIETEPALSALRERWPDMTWLDAGTPDKDVAAVSGVDVDVVISADVVEHFQDPDQLLQFLSDPLKIRCKIIVISTPDRFRLRDHPDKRVANKCAAVGCGNGPPYNKAHYREWTLEEFAEYVASRGFHVFSSRHPERQFENQVHVIAPPYVQI